MDYTQRVWIVYIIMFSLNFLASERYLILGTAKLSQHIYFEGFLNSKYWSKVMLLWKRGVVKSCRQACFSSCPAPAWLA